MRKLHRIKNSCALVALYHISKLSEDIIIELCKDHGFDANIGMADEEWLAAAADVGLKLRHVPIEPQKLRKFRNNFPKHTWLVRTHDHLFVLEGGIIIDPHNGGHLGLDRIIQKAWRVVKIRTP